MSKTWEGHLATVVNVVVLLTAVVVVAHPRGPIVPAIREWRAERQVRAELRGLWTELSQGSSVPSPPDNSRLIVVFSDYQCPACRHAETMLPTLQERLGFTVAYRHLPLSTLHPRAVEASHAAICAEEQSKFREMHAYLFRTRAWETTSNWEVAASASGVPDVEAFGRCMSADDTSKRLEADIALARRLKLTGTPTFVGPEGMTVGVPTDKQLLSLLGS